MKLYAVILWCFLAFCGARGADFFGTTDPATPGSPASSLANNFLKVPWGASPAEAKRVLVLPPGAIVKQDTPDRIVLTGGRFETYAVERWELEFVNGKFAKGVIGLVQSPAKNDKGWVNDQTFEGMREALDKMQGKSVIRLTEQDHREQVWAFKDVSGAVTAMRLYRGWTGPGRLDLTCTYDQSPKPVGPRPNNEIELREFLFGRRWTMDGTVGHTYEFLKEGTYTSPRNSSPYVITGPRRVLITWGPQLKVDCEFNEDFTEFKEHGGSRLVYRCVYPVPAVALAGEVSKPAEAIAAVAAPSDPISRDLVKTYRNSLVFVTGAEGNGSGFIAVSGGANFLFTNAHVAAGIRNAGFKTLDGTAVQIGAAASAVGHDIFRLQLGLGGKPFEIMQGVDENVTIDDEVVVLGNAEGAGVINTIKGKVVGVGPQLVEVDAPFQPGNSGSPIVHLKTGKVIGVATYLTVKKYDTATKEVLKAPVVRRFGYRLDSVKVWQPVNWPLFFAQAAEMQKLEMLTEDLGNFLVDLGKDSRVDSGAHTNPAIKTRIDQWLADKRKRLTQKDAANVDQNFLSFLKIACRSDINAAQPRLTYDYFQRQLAKEQQERAEIADIFDKIIKEIQSGK